MGVPVFRYQLTIAGAPSPAVVQDHAARLMSRADVVAVEEQGGDWVRFLSTLRPPDAWAALTADDPERFRGCLILQT